MRTTLVTAPAELEQVLTLQRENLRGHVSPEEALEQGFVTVAHTLDTLERMHAVAPSIIARDGERLAGYALVMPVETRAFIPILEPMFQLFDTLSWKGKPLGDYRYYVMGQVCVARDYRGQGIFDALYREHRASYADRYELCLTEIASRNTRSMRAHARVGFQPVTTYRDDTDEWVVVAWDWS
ncbi:GNAT family N-acetyltransferase [Corallococcus sp. H22C18031201]|uniref:GNAT family N-acetyltransferase n=1 Tax=Citreicoccus inhibens TaxID=2849499 RepID=UPI000E76D69F|nr:GNAT family N-acetyltransferase [Citreicoccus inhibens]MBU8898691.1 GNAT family N-acetyltransferase [Citreicoccus inhibens]RJS15945.1 GNAT family N-acetyltransferase [Corallococcus sp. H22C18031201]